MSQEKIRRISPLIISDNEYIEYVSETGIDADLTAQCGKIPYNSSAEAYNALRLIRSSKKKRSGQVAYKCLICGKYHLASNSRNTKYQRNRKRMH